MTLPINAELAAQLDTLTPQQLAFLAGVAWAKSHIGTAAVQIQSDSAAASATVQRRVTLISASQTGNARRVAETLTAQLQNAGIAAKLTAAADYKAKQLADEDIVLFITSTQGEGEPPEEAVPLFKLLGGKKAPNLAQIQFAVLGLGDSSYPKFCGAARDLDTWLAKLGGKRLLDAGLCDLDFQAAADEWCTRVLQLLSDLAAADSNKPAANTPNTADTDRAGTAIYTKEQPFSATLSVRQKITANGADKDVEHIEIDLAGSGIRYQPGDALGIWPTNDADLVAEILQLAGLDGNETLQTADGRHITIQAALQNELDITQNTPQFVHNYAQICGAETLQQTLQNTETLNAYLAATPPVGVMAAFAHPIDAQTLYGLFRPQTPRLYSIASAQDEVGEEVHLTVGLVAFEHHGRHYRGAASGLLKTAEEGSSLRVFVEPNRLFRLPENGSTPIIMIGAGTGIAPFRAFMQQREANGDSGKNWLLFGNRKFTDDFLYQAEWLRYRKDGLLTRADLAWSRQGSQKVYVQHKMHENAAEIWAWLQEGAHVYVCGDASKMARDVEDTLLHIIAEQGDMDRDDAEAYLNDLRSERRYQRDVY